MAVVEQVRFSIFSQQDIKELQNDVMQLEKLADRKDAAEKKIQESQLAKRGGIFAPNELDETLPRAITRKQGKALGSRVEQSKLANSIKNKDTTSAAAFVRSNAFKKVQGEIDLLKEGQQKNQRCSFIYY